MRGLARRLDDEAREVEARGQASRGDPRLRSARDARVEILENIHEYRPKPKRRRA